MEGRGDRLSRNITLPCLLDPHCYSQRCTSALFNRASLFIIKVARWIIHTQEIKEHSDERKQQEKNGGERDRAVMWEWKRWEREKNEKLTERNWKRQGRGEGGRLKGDKDCVKEREWGWEKQEKKRCRGEEAPHCCGLAHTPPANNRKTSHLCSACFTQSGSIDMNHTAEYDIFWTRTEFWVRHCNNGIWKNVSINCHIERYHIVAISAPE